MRTAIDNYLKAIFECSFSKRKTTNKQLADYLKVAPPSVNGTIKKLEEKGLVYRRPYGPIMLSDVGLQQTLKLIRHFRLCESWLVYDFDLPLQLVPRQAWLISDFDNPQIINQLNNYLNYPKFSPFGGAIQDSNLMTNDGSQPLINFNRGQRVRINSYLESENMINVLQTMNLDLKQTLTIISYNPHKQMLKAKREDSHVLNISEEIAKCVYVSTLDS